MSLPCLNCWGLGDPRAVDDLHVLFSRLKSNIVFLSETKHSSYEMGSIKHKLDDYDGIHADSCRRFGGLALLWDKILTISLMSYSFHHIDIRVGDGLGASPWRFSGIYGWPESQAKLKSCHMIEDLTGHSSLPWVTGGDLHEIFFNSKKYGGPPKANHSLILSTNFHQLWLIRSWLYRI